MTGWSGQDVELDDLRIHELDVLDTLKGFVEACDITDSRAVVALHMYHDAESYGMHHHTVGGSADVLLCLTSALLREIEHAPDTFKATPSYTVLTEDLGGLRDGLMTLLADDE